MTLRNRSVRLWIVIRTNGHHGLYSVGKLEKPLVADEMSVTLNLLSTVMKRDLSNGSQRIDLTPTACVIFRAAATPQVVNTTGC